MNIAERIASVLNARKSGSYWQTTTAHCHPGGDNRAGLSFWSPDSDPDKLLVLCWTRGCHETADGRNRARDNLRAAAGLPAWQPTRPDGHRAAQRPPGGIYRCKGNSAPETPENAATDAQRAPGGDTAEYAARMWAAASNPGTAPSANHPVGLWLRNRGVWPIEQPLPEAVRWLPREQLPRGGAVNPDSTAAGALVLAMRPLSDLVGEVRKVGLVAIDKRGRKAFHWEGGRDKCTYGADRRRVGLLSHWPLDSLAGHDLHVCEGLADGLAILSGLPFLEERGLVIFDYARASALVVAVAVGKSYTGIDPVLFDSVTVWPDADDPDALPKAREQGQTWANLGCRIAIKHLPAGYDPAAYSQEWRNAE